MKPIIRSTPGRSTDHVPIALAAVAVAQLYYPETEWRTSFFSKSRSEFLADALTSPPQPNALQARLNAVLGGATEAHLYLPRFEGDTPTHYIALIRNDDNLWHLRHVKVRAVANRQSFGAIISWPARPGSRASVTPIPEVCIEIQPTITPILKGKGAHDTFIDTMVTQTQPPSITQSQFSHSIIVSRLFGAQTTDRIPIWFPDKNDKFEDRCTRISFRVNSDNDGWTLPFSFDEAAVRKSLPFSAKKNITIVHTPKDQVFPHSPKIDPMDDYALGDMKFVLEQLLIESRIVPYVGVTQDSSHVDLYTALFYPDTNTVHTAMIASGRRMSHCENIPVIKPWAGYDGYWIPNYTLAQLLRYFTVLNDQAARVLPYFGAAKIASYNKVFGRYDLTLSDEELSKLSSETGISTSSAEDQTEL